MQTYLFYTLTNTPREMVNISDKSRTHKTTNFRYSLLINLHASMNDSKKLLLPLLITPREGDLCPVSIMIMIPIWPPPYNQKPDNHSPKHTSFFDAVNVPINNPNRSFSRLHVYFSFF